MGEMTGAMRDAMACAVNNLAQSIAEREPKRGADAEGYARALVMLESVRASLEYVRPTGGAQVLDLSGALRGVKDAS